MYKIVDLRKKQEYLKQYVDLRNLYVNELLTSEVTVDDTIEWLSKSDVEIYGLVEKGVLLGVILVYVEKQGEISFFVKEPGRGYGAKLLKVADEIARKRNLSFLWAWTKKENLAAIRAFEKNDYQRKKEQSRTYQGKKLIGYFYQKQYPER